MTHYLQTESQAPAVEITATNGNRGVTFSVAESGHPMRTESVAAKLTPEEATHLGLALIIHALNAAAGDHDNGDNARQFKHLTQAQVARIAATIEHESGVARANANVES